MSDDEATRTNPVILITGTPGTGKTTHAQLLAQLSPEPLNYINIGDLVKEKGLHEGFDEEWQSYIVDDDKVRFNFFHSIIIVRTCHVKFFCVSLAGNR